MPPCTRFIAREDPHSKCILCLGFSHAREAVYGTSNCEICDDFRLITLRSRLEDYERESSKFSRRASSTNAPPREIAASREAAASRRAASWGSDVELEEMESEQTGLAFSLPPSSERARANSPVEFLPDFQFPSPKARDFVSFGLDDILHTAASDSEDFGPALADALPPSSQEARPSAAYSELVDVLSRATEKLALDWPDEPRESRASKLDDRFLIGAHSKLERRKLPFFSDLHREISSSWKQPFSSRLTNAAAADFTNLVGSVEQGYTAMPVIEDTLASHLSPSLAPSWKSRPLLPSKPCRTTSALIGKSYIAAGQAGMALHTMAILQAYQADVLKEMDEGTGLTPEAVKELRRATDLALRATKHTARAVGRSMAASVAAERHLWLNLTEIREREKTFLMDAPISQSGLFGEAVSAVVDKFRSAKTQSAALNQFMPRRARDFSTPSSSVSREQPPPRREPPSGGAQATRLPPTTKLKPGEWMLNRQTVSQIWDLFGKAEVDLFASQESSQCPLWFSLSFPTTLGIDAFAHPWPNVSLYAFPPIKLIPAVLCRVKVSGARLLLIAPFWPSQTWFSELTPLLYRPPWEIPIRRDLLSQLQGKIWHPQPELWKLWVWPIQGQGL